MNPLTEERIREIVREEIKEATVQTIAPVITFSIDRLIELIAIKIDEEREIAMENARKENQILGKSYIPWRINPQK